jgi:hypothetical protein
MNEGEIFFAFEKITNFKWVGTPYTNKYGLIDKFIQEEDISDFSFENEYLIKKSLSIIGFVFLLNIPVALINIF